MTNPLHYGWHNDGFSIYFGGKLARRYTTKAQLDEAVALFGSAATVQIALGTPEITDRAEIIKLTGALAQAYTRIK